MGRCVRADAPLINEAVDSAADITEPSSLAASSSTGAFWLSTECMPSSAEVSRNEAPGLVVGEGVCGG